MIGNRVRVSSGGALPGFTFQIVTSTPSETFTLPLGASGANVQIFTVYWGDGESDEITAYNDAAITHTYDDADTYNIRMDGICEYFGFNNAGDKTLITKLVSLTYDLGFETFNFYGCTSLDEIDSSIGLISSVTTFANAFRTCNSLETLPSELFDNSATTTVYSNMFRDCTALSTVPTGLFDGCTGALDMQLVFFNTNALTSVPSGLFATCTSVTTFYGILWGGALDAIPPNLFANNSSLLNAASMFASAPITEIPDGLFDGLTSATSFDNCFHSCVTHTSIPTGLFDNCTEVTNFGGAFYGNTGVTLIPDGLFDNNTKATLFDATFYNCTSMAGAIPDNLFDSCVLATNFSLTFYNNDVTSIPTGLFKYNTNATLFPGTFWACNLVSEALYGDMFVNCEVNNFNDCFRNDTGLTGVGWSGIIARADAQSSPPSSTARCFSGATNLTEFVNIPSAWKT